MTNGDRHDVPLRRHLLTCFILALLPSLATAQWKVEPDKENVVASRLEGDWSLDAALTERLDAMAIAKRITFKADAAVTARIPQKYAQLLENKRIYLAGTLTFNGSAASEHPFILIEYHGNPYLVWFRERAGEPLGDAESSNVMLAVARERDPALPRRRLQQSAFSGLRSSKAK